MVPTVVHKIGPKIDTNSFEISQFYFPIFQVEQNPFQRFQIGAKKSLNLGSVPNRVEVSTERSVCPGL